MNVNWKIRVARSTTTKQKAWFNIKLKSKTEQKTTSTVSFHVHNKENGEGVKSF